MWAHLSIPSMLEHRVARPPPPPPPPRVHLLQHPQQQRHQHQHLYLHLLPPRTTVRLASQPSISGTATELRSTARLVCTRLRQPPRVGFLLAGLGHRRRLHRLHHHHHHHHLLLLLAITMLPWTPSSPARPQRPTSIFRPCMAAPRCSRTSPSSSTAEEPTGPRPRHQRTVRREARRQPSNDAEDVGVCLFVCLFNRQSNQRSVTG